MNIQERRDKNGNIISYRIRVFSHRDINTGKQVFKNHSFKYDETKSETWNRKQAEKQAAVFEKSVEELTATTSNITFNDYADYVIEAKVRSGIIAKSTAHGQRYKRRRSAPFVGHIQLKNLTPNVLNRAYIDMLKADVPIKTVREIHGFIQGVLTVAFKENIIPRNYASAAMPPKCERPEITAISEDELKAFFTALYSKEKHYAYKVLFTLMIATACRIGEITALSWDNVDFTEGRIQICQHFVQDESGVYVKEGSKTKAGVRWLYLDDRMMEMLYQYRDYYLSLKMKYGSKWVNTNAVFTVSHKPGDYIQPHTVREWLTRFLKMNSLKHIRPHQFRHTSVSLQLQEGISIPDIAKRAGHSRPDVTLSVYAHTMRNNDKHLSEAVTKSLPMINLTETT